MLINFTTPTKSRWDLESSGCLFPVEEQAIGAHGYDEAEDGTKVPKSSASSYAPSHKAIVRTDTKTVLGVVGSRYKLMLNEEYFGAIEQALEEAVPKEMLEGCQVRTRTTGSWTHRDYVLPAYADEVHNSVHKTKVGLRIIASNSYDGGSSARLLCGLIDFYCTNGMVVGTNIERAARRHSARLSPDQLIRPLQDSISRTNEEIEKIGTMLNTPVRTDDVVDLLEKEFSASRSGQLLARFEKEREERGSNVFALYSAMTYYSSHHSEEFPTRGEEPNLRLLEAREEEVAKVVRGSRFQKLLEVV